MPKETTLIYSNTAPPVIIVMGSPLEPTELPLRTISSCPPAYPNAPASLFHARQAQISAQDKPKPGSLPFDMAIPAVSVDLGPNNTSFSPDKDDTLKILKTSYNETYKNNGSFLFQKATSLYKNTELITFINLDYPSFSSKLALYQEVIFLSWCCIQYCQNYNHDFSLIISKRLLDRLNQILELSDINNNYPDEYNTLVGFLNKSSALIKNIFTSSKLTIEITGDIDFFFLEIYLSLRKLQEISSARTTSSLKCE